MNTETIRQLLGITKSVPLSLVEMGQALRVCFYPKTTLTPRLQLFKERLCSLLTVYGVKILGYEQALQANGSERVCEGIVTIAVGEISDDDLPIHHVSSLAENIVVQIFDRGCPAHSHKVLQSKLNTIMADMAWNFAHVVIYLEAGGEPTICNMNGAITTCDDDAALAAVLIPKLAAPVVPPRSTDFQFREHAFDPRDLENHASARDIVESGNTWASTGLMVSQTPVSTLRFRNSFYRKLGGIYLDHRTGMSYGFLARQLPVSSLKPALTLREARVRWGVNIDECRELFEHDGALYLCLNIAGESYVLQVPDVWILSTRSGCEKTRLDIKNDIVRYGLRNGQIVFETPRNPNGSTDCKPSYDTLVIVAHALSNAIIASVLARQEPNADFSRRLKAHGVALAHWHGFLPHSKIPTGYPMHGQGNPAVACSTPQSAIYAIQGKIRLLENGGGTQLKGDIHIEPHHGTNFTCNSLQGLAQWLLAIGDPSNDPQPSLETFN